MWITPCPEGELLEGTITVQPEPVGVFALPNPIAFGESTSTTIEFPDVPITGGSVCFRLTLLTETGSKCCTEIFQIDFPSCGQAQLLGQTVACEPQPDGSIKYTIGLTVRNRTDFSDEPYAFAHATFLPPDGFSPSEVALTPIPISPGNFGVVTTDFIGMPGEICFHLGLHDETLELCSSIENICIELPECAAMGGPGILQPPQEPRVPRFTVRDLELTANSTELVMRVPTVAGWRYHIQHSAALEGWRDTQCEVLGVDTNPEGIFEGTGSVVTVVVPCDLSVRQVFYRAVEHDTGP